MPGLEHVRSQSLFGLADVEFYFGWDTSYAHSSAARGSTSSTSSTCQRAYNPSSRPGARSASCNRYKGGGQGIHINAISDRAGLILEKQFRQYRA